MRILKLQWFGTADPGGNALRVCHSTTHQHRLRRGIRPDTIEEIVVTSRRRAESVQDVPLAVTAFNSEDIERINPDTLRDIDGRMPNVFIGRQTAGPQMGAIYIRGLGYADVEKNIPPAVGVIIDGVFQGTNTGQLIDMFDVEQVEVNRGPQGVLYGKNTTGGTIVVKRVQPEFNEFGISIAGELGNYDKTDLKGPGQHPHHRPTSWL